VTETVEAVEHKNLAEALVAFQGEVGTVAKDANNPFFQSKYADLPAVKAAAQPILTKHGIAVVQEPGFTVVADKVYDTLTTTVIHGAGGYDNWLKSTMILKPAKNDPQAQGSAITYARRYAFMAVLGLVADEDDDGNAASAKARPTRAKAPKPADPDDENAAEVRKAVQRVKAAAKAAGFTPEAGGQYFKETYKESLISCTDLDKLTEAAVYFETKAAPAE
jgi:hypothetical protein